MNTIAEQTKTCKKCGTAYPATIKYFIANKTGKDGLRPYCKYCEHSYKDKPVKAIPIKDKPVVPSQRNANIYRTYCRTECDTPTKRKMLAKFYNIGVDKLNLIIKTEDEKQMKLSWTEEKCAELLACYNSGSTKEQLAAAYGTTPHNIENRLHILRKAAQKPVSEPTPLEVVDPVNTYADCDSTSAVGETVQDESVKVEPKPIHTVNAKIRELCETPDPETLQERREVSKLLQVAFPPKPDYAESLISVLADEAIDRKEAMKTLYAEANTRNDLLNMMDGIINKQNDLIISEPPKPLPVKPRTIFDEAHRALWNLESMAKRSQINTKYIHMDIGGFNVSTISAECGDAEANVSINKKYQSTAGTAD